GGTLRERMHGLEHRECAGQIRAGLGSCASGEGTRRGEDRWRGGCNHGDESVDRGGRDAGVQAVVGARRRVVRDVMNAWDVMLFAGLGCIIWGVWQISPPAAWIIGGLLLSVLAALGQLNGSAPKNSQAAYRT